MTGKQEESFMRGLIKTFCDDIRGKRREDFKQPFWDLVVITTMDEDQKDSYEIQIENKIKNKELPIDIPFHVIADQPGYKIGNGGSTMYCMHILNKIYGDGLFLKKTLIIHAGGMSQRLPSVSVPGKVFLPFPIGEPIFQALELLLCIFIPFISKMNPGFLVTASDMLIGYHLNASEIDWSFKNPGFTALAHPSPLHIGEKHGVYVLGKPPSKAQMRSSIFMANCVKVLQKNSIQKLHEHGAVIKVDSDPDMVYTDSCFYFDTETAKDLVAFYENNKPLKCEIDAYGDFLTALGSMATDEHTENVGNVMTVTKDLIKMRKEVFQLLHRKRINLLVMNKSKFYHVGTLKELIQNVCIEKHAIEQFGLGRFVASKTLGKGSGKRINGVVMHSIVNNESAIPYNSIVSYSRLSVPVVLGRQNIISNCSIGNIGRSNITVVLPDNVMFHTIPLSLEKTTSFVTVAFGFDDDVKMTVPLAEMHKLTFFGISMTKVLEILGIEEKLVCKSHDCSLWKAKIFANRSTEEESFFQTLQQVLCIKNGQRLVPLQKHTLYSMADILSHKDASLLVKYRVNLKEDIYRD